MTCREIVELASDYLEGTLAPADLTQIEHHLDGCDGCTAYVAQLKATVLATGATDGNPAPDREAARALFRRFQADC
jgi:anti-sigma factor RsiW